eukprot:Tbor_TRINITY_DN5672_c1_g6::TRINITY_DN5672_c1_g6_i2::g.9481::m.9481
MSQQPNRRFISSEGQPGVKRPRPRADDVHAQGQDQLHASQNVAWRPRASRRNRQAIQRGIGPLYTKGTPTYTPFSPRQSPEDRGTSRYHLSDANATAPKGEGLGSVNTAHKDGSSPGSPQVDIPISIRTVFRRPQGLHRMEVGHEGGRSSGATAHLYTTKGYLGRAGKSGSKKGHATNSRSNRTGLAPGRKRGRCPTTPEGRHKGPGRVHDGDFPSGKDGQKAAVHCRNPPSISSNDGIPADLGLPRSERREPQRGTQSYRSGARTEEPETRPIAASGIQGMDGCSAPGGVPACNNGHAPPLPRHGDGIQHHRGNGITGHIPSSQRRLQGFLEGNFGVEDCPSAEEMQKSFPSLSQYQKRHLPIQLKKVDIIEQSALWALPSEHKECWLHANQQWRWVNSNELHRDLNLLPFVL